MPRQIQKPNRLRQYAENISLANGAVTLAFFGLYFLAPFGIPAANATLSMIGICCFVGWANVLAVRAVNTDAVNMLARLRHTDTHLALTSLAPNPDNSPTPPRNPNIALIVDALREDDSTSAETLAELLTKRGPTLDDVAKYYKAAGKKNLECLEWHERVTYTGLAFVFLTGVIQIYASTLSTEKKEASKPWFMAAAFIFALSFGISSLNSIRASNIIAQLKTEADSVNHHLTMAIIAVLQKKQVIALSDRSGSTEEPTTINPLPRTSQTTTTGAGLFSPAPAPAGSVHIGGGNNITIICQPGTPVPVFAANQGDLPIEFKLV